MAKKKRAKAKKKAKAKKIKKAKIVKKAKAKIKRKAKPKSVAVKKAKKRVMKKEVMKKEITKKEKELPAIANLIVTFDPNHAGLAETEVRDAFKRVNEELKFLKSEIEGVFKIATSKPKEAVKKLVRLCADEPELFKTTHQYVPIDKWCSSQIKDMQNVVKDMEKGIKESERWRMTLNKRGYDKPAMDLIITLTDVINKPKVDLQNPEKIIRVEIFGDKAGISLLKADEALSVHKPSEE